MDKYKIIFVEFFLCKTNKLIKCGIVTMCNLFSPHFCKNFHLVAITGYGINGPYDGAVYPITAPFIP